MALKQISAGMDWAELPKISAICLRIMHKERERIAVRALPVASLYHETGSLQPANCDARALDG